MNNINKFAIGALLTTVVSGVSAATYTIDFTSMNSMESISKPYIDYNYNGDSFLRVSGVSGSTGPVNRENIYQLDLWGLYVDGNTYRTTNSNVDWPYNQPVFADQWNFQALFFEFDELVTLNTLTLSDGHYWFDNHLSILALTDSNYGVDFNITWSNLLNNGWEHVGNPNAYKGIGLEGSFSMDASALSRYWLISAFNPAFGGEGSYYADGFNLGQINFTVSEVPLPAAVWVFLTGLVGMRLISNRKKKYCDPTAI